MKKLVKESLNEKRGNTIESSPLKKLYQAFSDDGIELDEDELDEDSNGFWAENKNGVRAFITPAGDDFYFDILVQGMSEDIPITDIQFNDVIDIFDDLDEDWLKENDPEGDQY